VVFFRAAPFVIAFKIRTGKSYALNFIIDTFFIHLTILQPLKDCWVDEEGIDNEVNFLKKIK